MPPSHPLSRAGAPCEPRGRVSARRGAALIVVLGAVLLLTVIVMAFFSSVRTDYVATRYEADGTSVRALADSVTQLVQAQIRTATTNGNGAWASQPGMIRTYTAQGGKGDVFRLYSWSSLRESAAAFSAATDRSELTGWDGRPAVFTDLNEPVIAAGLTNYPILDPGLQGKVEGFSVTAAPVATGVPVANPAPMPVRWLYVLANGEIVWPDATSSNPRTATFTDSKLPVRPSAQNPIVGRVAFWTDDETCKLNVNTASEGTPWDSPRANTPTERGNDSGMSAPWGFASSVPFPNEFQRMPGHPAMTCLSPALGYLLPIPDPPHGWSPASAATAYDQALRGYLNLTPRVNFRDTNGNPAGSLGGSVPTGVNLSVNNKPEILPDPDRLYTTTDEFFFNMQRQTNSPATPADIQGLRFFLSTSSRAPDITPFNTPRLSLWPLMTDKRSYKERFIAFCATLGSNSSGPITYSVTRGRTPIESSAPSSRDHANGDLFMGDARNLALYQYFGAMLKRDVPGFGGKFSDKYDSDNLAQIQAGCFDYLRSCINLEQVPLGTSDANNLFYSYTLDATTANTSGGGGKFVAPGRYPNAQGFGRAPVITEVGLLFYATNSTGTNTDLHALLYFQPTLLSPAHNPYSPWVYYECEGLDSLKINGVSAGFPSGKVATESGHNQAWTTLDGRHPYGNSLEVFYNRLGANGAPGTLTRKVLGTGDPTTHYPFWNAVPVRVSGSNFVFDGGTITMRLYSGADGGRTSPFQTYTFTFPPLAAVPVPQRNTPVSPLDRLVTVHDADKILRMREFIGPNDVTRSLMVNPLGAARGDFRVVAANPSVPASYFTPVPNYSNSLVWQTHTLRMGWVETGRRNVEAKTDNYIPAGDYPAAHFGRAKRRSANGIDNPNVNLMAPYSNERPDGRLLSGTLVQGLANAYDANCPSVTPRGLNGALKNDVGGQRAGDWDNGIGAVPDGPYLGAPDLSGPNKGDSSGSTAEAPNEYGYVYYTGKWGEMRGFTPTRQIPSAVRFGSLPTGAREGSSFCPWRTLLFCPNPPSRSTASTSTPDARDHFGFGALGTRVPDHALLEFFQMPVVEPYAISEPLSTAGKVNLNHQIVPFTHITRTTALRGVLKSIRFMAIAAIDGQQNTPFDTIYKSQSYQGAALDRNRKQHKFEMRYDVDRDETLRGWGLRFTRDNDLYRHASEVCDLFLVPKKLTGGSVDYGKVRSKSATYNDIVSWWNFGASADVRFSMTGDNTREAPYGDMYPRLTTRSNTYTVHLRVQVLKQAPANRRTAADWATWNEDTDAVAAEYRGATTLERYVDPNDTRLPDFAADWTPDKGATAPENNINRYYRFRVVSQRQFAP